MYKKFAFTIFLIFAVLSLVYALKSDRDVTTSSDLAYEMYQEGIKLQEQFYHRDACEQYEAAVAEDGEFAMALARLSHCYEQLGFKEKGKATWERAKAQKESVSDRERLLLDMWDANCNHDTAQVRALAQQYVNEYPQDREGYLVLGGLEMMNSNFEAAIELFSDALEADPQYANGHNMLGYLNYYLGRYDEALRHLSEYSRLAPNEANPHDSRGEILHAMGRYEEAIDEFRAAFNINPDFAYAVEHMAWSYLALGRTAKVDYCFNTLNDRAESEERQLYFRLEYGEALLVQEEYDSALAIFNEVSANNGESMTALKALYDIGYAYYLQRDLDNARSTFYQAGELFLSKAGEDSLLNKDDMNTQCWYDWVQAMLADLEGDLDKSSGLLASLVDLEGIPTKKMRVRYYFADVLFRKGEVDRAKSELQKNLSINPSHTRSLLLLADIYEAEEDHQSALSYRQRVQEIWSDADPDFKPARQLRAKISASVAMVGAE